MKKKALRQKRDPLIIFIASLMILIGGALMVCAVMFARDLGWWALAPGLTGLSSVAAATTSLITNDRAWILVDLILP